MGGAHVGLLSRDCASGASLALIKITQTHYCMLPWTIKGRFPDRKEEVGTHFATTLKLKSCNPISRAIPREYTIHKM
jgi:hypothetical protein